MRVKENVVFMNLCMVCHAGQVVVINRQKPDWPGITFPGGHVEEGESFADSVIREVKEETGLTIHSPALCGTVNWCEKGSRYVVFLYKATSFTGKLCSSEEGDVWWEDLAELPQQKLSSGMADYLHIFMEDTFSEIYYCENSDGTWSCKLK